MPKHALVFLAVLAVCIGLSPADGRACPIDKGVYTLIEDSAYTLVMSAPDPNSAVEIARARVEHNGTPFLEGYVTVSQGAGSAYFVPHDEAMEDADIRMMFLDGRLRVSHEDAAYIVTPALISALYYGAPDVWQKHQLKGEVWKRESCQ